jgi:alkylhydroperoxidase/carboxymuconolactone decarboxylase family protein YurZ
MHMLDWNTYRQQLLAGVCGFGKLNPDIIKGYTTLSRAGQKAGHIDEKTRELIALAVAITLRCDGKERPEVKGISEDQSERSDSDWLMVIS